MENLTTVLVASGMIAPSALYFAWLIRKNRRMKAAGLTVRPRVRAVLISIISALVGCLVIAAISRSLETSSESSWLVMLSVFSAYSFYFFVASNLLLTLSLTLLLIVVSQRKKPNQTPEPTAADGRGSS